MDRKRKPGIYLLTDAGDAVELILVWLDGRETRLRGQSPVEELVSFVNFDFSTYRASVEHLWEEHDVFEERLEVPYEDYVDFARQALPLAEQLSEIAPVAYWDVLHHLDPATKMLYDGKPIFPSRKALAVLNALRHPYFIQNRLRNLFEIGFADFERGTQQDRFRALEDTWPGLIDRAFPIRFLPELSGAPVGTVREYALDDLYELCLAELSLYFQQNRRRIARCENCWRYFVPKTEAESRYCYGEMDGKPCKQEGAKRMHRFRADTDEALAAYERLRRRLEERANRLELAGPGGENHLIPFGRTQYEAWLDGAWEAKKAYQAGGISAEEFLRRIDVDGELDGYQAARDTFPAPGQTPWRDYIKRDMDFIPGKRFTDMLYLDLSADDPAWTMITAEEQIRKARGGHASLHDRYGVKDPVDPKAHAKELEAMFSPCEPDPQVELMKRLIAEAARISMQTVWPKENSSTNS